MPHQFNPAHKEKLDTPQRRRDLPPEKILEKFALDSDNIAADVGCGIGYFTIPIARVVDNQVYAFDLSQEMLDEVALKREEEGLDNIKLVNTSQEEDYIPENKIDFMLMSNLVHEVADKKEFLKKYLMGLKPGGRLVVIDFKKQSSQSGPPAAERISKAKLYKLLEEDLGLTLKIAADLNEEQYALAAEK